MKQPAQKSDDWKDCNYHARPIAKRIQPYCSQYSEQFWLLVCVWTSTNIAAFRLQNS